MKNEKRWPKQQRLSKLNSLGIGVGLRPVHYPEIFASEPPIDWFEIISENFMMAGDIAMRNLEKILERYPVVQHGVSLSIGSSDPLDFDYLKRLKELVQITKTPWISDHLSWGRLEGAHYHDLLPLPYTQKVIDHVVEKARIVQDYLEIPFALENLSSYASFKQDEMPEWEFYAAIVERADIFMMLDVNNIYVSSRNHGFDSKQYYSQLPLDRVIQIHLAGHVDYGDYCLDTHDHPVCDEVWKLYGDVIALTGPVSTLLEWDDNLPPFDAICQEALKAKQYQQVVLHA